jgi:hypothetical protein
MFLEGFCVLNRDNVRNVLPNVSQMEDADLWTRCLWTMPYISGNNASLAFVMRSGEWQWIRPLQIWYTNILSSVSRGRVSVCRGRGANPSILVFDTTISWYSQKIKLHFIGYQSHAFGANRRLGGESTTWLGGESSKPVWGEYAVGRIHQIPLGHLARLLCIKFREDILIGLINVARPVWLAFAE